MTMGGIRSAHQRSPPWPHGRTYLSPAFFTPFFLSFLAKKSSRSAILTRISRGARRTSEEVGYTREIAHSLSPLSPECGRRCACKTPLPFPSPQRPNQLLSQRKRCETSAKCGRGNLREWGPSHLHLHPDTHAFARTRTHTGPRLPTHDFQY